jgi:tripeptidyl-peptidase-1
LNIYAYHCQSTGLYNITDGKTATKGNELGIFESIGDIYAQEDLDEFFKVLAP